MKAKNLILIATLFLCCTACEMSEGEIKIDQESKDYCLFAPGSYWIYQDSATLKEDSVAINSISYMFTRSVESGYDCEQYRFGVYSNVPFLDVRLTTGDADGSLLKPCILSTGTLGVKYHNGEVGECFNYPDLVLLERKNSCILNETTYIDVKIFKDPNTYTETEKIIYWAKHIGLIREEIYTNDSITVKNLIKYNVKPYNQ